MALEKPFNVDAASMSAQQLAKLPAHGGTEIRAFCGIDQVDHDWNARGVCVLSARRGFGKSHLLGVRSLNHRESAAASKTLFYPVVRKSLPIDTLGGLNVVVPRWLQGKDAVNAWMQIWQLAILGLVVWIADARAPGLRGYADWFDGLSSAGGSPDQGPANAMLSWFIARVVRNMPGDDFGKGVELLQAGLYHAGSDWVVAISAGLATLDRTHVALYLDAPDELVGIDQPGIWRNIQQGLLLAIWKFARNTLWSSVLAIYASVRSEAFGTGQDHPDVPLAMGLVLALRYSRGDLKAMLEDRIRQADPTMLALPLDEAVDPIEALCGFAHYFHDDRYSPSGSGVFREPVLDSILRHTRMAPREVVGMGGAIYELPGMRDAAMVRRAVNDRAKLDMAYAIERSLLGWTEVDHARFALMLDSEVIDAHSMAQLVDGLGTDGRIVLKFFLRHGLVGVAEHVHTRHRHYYRQHFSFGEAQGGGDAASLSKDFFFVHPALKEWIQVQPSRLGVRFATLKSGVVGHGQPFEARLPLVRLGAVGGSATLTLHTGERLAIGEHGSGALPMKLLFAVLWACRELRQTRINLGELHAAVTKIESEGPSRISGLRGLAARLKPSPSGRGETARHWCPKVVKKINSDERVRRLQHLLINPSWQFEGPVAPPSVPFISCGQRSDLGDELELTLTMLPLEELDWDDAIHARLDQSARRRNE